MNALPKPQLEEILVNKRAQLQQRQARTPMAAVVALAEMQQRPLSILNRVTGGSEICILGSIRRTEIYDPVGSALRYKRLGVDGLTLYTDDDLYGDGLEDLLLVTRAVNVPVISFDYVLDGYHVAEARAAGASALTMYAALLDDLTLRRTVSLTQRWRMTAILQIDREAHIEHLRTLSPHVTAVGNPLEPSASNDLDLLRRLRASIPYNVHYMPLHPLTTLTQVAEAVEIGVDAFTCSASLLKNAAVMNQVRAILHKPGSLGGV